MTPLDTDTVVRALRTPYTPLRELALACVSLSRYEYRCVYGCVIEGYTNEELAELIDRSPKFVSRHKNDALRRLSSAWARMDKQLLADMLDY